MVGVKQHCYVKIIIILSYTQAHSAERTKKCLQNFNVKRSLTVIVFDEAGLETFQFIARDDCLGLNIYITLKSSRDWKKEKVHFITCRHIRRKKEKNPFIISFFFFFIGKDGTVFLAFMILHYLCLVSVQCLTS